MSQLARALRFCSEQAWRLRWGSLIACAVARAVALSPWSSSVQLALTLAAYDVEGDFRHVGLAWSGALVSLLGGCQLTVHFSTWMVSGLLCVENIPLMPTVDLTTIAMSRMPWSLEIHH